MPNDFANIWQQQQQHKKQKSEAPLSNGTTPKPSVQVKPEQGDHVRSDQEDEEDPLEELEQPSLCLHVLNQTQFVQVVPDDAVSLVAYIPTLRIRLLSG